MHLGERGWKMSLFSLLIQLSLLGLLASAAHVHVFVWSFASSAVTGRGNVPFQPEDTGGVPKQPGEG